MSCCPHERSIMLLPGAAAPLPLPPIIRPTPPLLPPYVRRGAIGCLCVDGIPSMQSPLRVVHVQKHLQL